MCFFWGGLTACSCGCGCSGDGLLAVLAGVRVGDDCLVEVLTGVLAVAVEVVGPRVIPATVIELTNENVFIL